ncbi:hypothetical protein K388_06951 [Streptomyces sp. KhCrAH-43]|uniref:hypothetical protein n=1 Tax=unclassified Streptomyces TaxID=2593676 RepID=UPI000381861E|nr:MULTISPECIES: hypothetical protein [unclassified Streptomyces]MYS32941.1 hypothetical protein [Streptomyces sp. SID4920]MYX64268.1 hypothetical protein [Streptomyces sp. SID8373]RAJ48685.1 hypothetical protein K388_06951 [Streptomyces sp. KhCrAH-43]
MPRVTRQHTVAHHLVQGGFTDLRLTEAAQKKDRPGLYREDGFAVRSYLAPDGTLLTVAGAYGPDWVMTLAQIRYRLERPYVRYTVTDDAPELRDHELLVRWATREELQARKQAEAARQAPLVAQLRRQQCEQDAEDAGQSALF